MELNKNNDSQNFNNQILNNKVVVEESQTLLEESEEGLKEVKPIYGICMKCKQPRSHYQWCQPCERKQIEENLTKWTSGNKEIDEFLQETQLNSIKPQTFLEWIPFGKLENISILCTTSRSTVYSAFWKDGPRKWDQQNEQYKRSGIQVIIKLYKDSNDIDQINEILNELKIYLDCHAQECGFLFQFYGISKQPDSNDYFAVKQFPQNGSLLNYIPLNFDSLYWEMKLHLLLCLAEDLKVLHDAGYVHRYLHPSSVLVFDDNFCAIGTFSKCCKVSSNTEEIVGWYHYMAPEYLLQSPYTKSSDIYSFGMIMHTIGTGIIPHRPLCISQSLNLDICLGLRPHTPHNIPKSFKDLMERCWNTEPCLRPNIHEVYNVLLNLWSSIYHNNHLTSLNSKCIEFLVADNNEDYSKSNSQEIITQKPENNNLEPLEMIKYIRESSLVKVFNIDELTMMTPINNDKFCKISKATLKTKETNMIVVCRRIKCNQLDRPFFHELNKRKRLYLCLRILRVLGISLDKNTEEYLLVMQFADSGNLRWYLKDHFSKLTWNDKLKFSYQITEGIKYLHDEDICHQSLHSRNIVIHSNEAKIILYIMKSIETDYLSVSDEMIPYVDPKLLENQSYEYDKKSDIYSLGVLMWELTSGYPPFIYNEAENHLVIDLINGHREKSIPKTPNAYLDLYESCWDPEPNERPSINQVFSKLGKMYTQTNTNLKMSEIINLIKNNFLVRRIINIGELSDINGNTTWKKQAVIYKKYKFDQLNEAFIHELKMHRKLNFYSRFVQILGISLDESAEECLLIMQHAEDGNLRQYLKSHFLELSWDDKIKLSYQITEGIKYLHNEDILHQNLNPNNIVIHKNEAKIVLDFVKITESGYSSDYGMISYIDPKLLENYSYEYDKKSDIYSLGVLMWEITSGYPPKTENISKSHNIDGCRETPIPVEYLDLCESCWNNEPDKRPSISLVFNKLVEMNKNSASQFINLIKKHTRIINRNELLDMEKIDGGHFGIISKATTPLA